MKPQCTGFCYGKTVQGAIETLLKDRTSIIIAHRLSTILQVDRILVLEKEKLEKMEHEELLKRKESMPKCGVINREDFCKRKKNRKDYNYSLFYLLKFHRFHFEEGFFLPDILRKIKKHKRHIQKQVRSDTEA